MNIKRYEIWECEDIRYIKLDGIDNLNPNDHEDWLRPLFPQIMDVAVDVGAHVGTHTLRLARTCSTVHAFEPNPANRRFLEWNLALNSIKNVSIYPVALGARSGTGTMDESGGPSRLGAKGKFVVPITTLDSIATSWSQLDFVKIDVEGFELDVLRGSRETLIRLKPQLLIEMHHLYDNNTRLLETVELELRSMGYDWTVFTHPQFPFSYYMSCV